MAKRDVDNFEETDQTTTLPNGKNYLFTIGIDAYEHCDPLNNAVKDAQDVAKVLLEKYNFDKAQHTALENKEATKDNIIAAFRSLKRKIKEEDNLLIYYSGHGALDKDFDESYWIPVECREGKIGDYLALDQLTKFVKAIKTHHTLLIIDACFAGAALVTRRSNTDALEKDPSRYVIASGRKEYADDGIPGENSPFAAAILEKLRNNEKSLLATDLGQYAMKQTIKATKKTQRPIHNPLQIPEDKGGQFVFHPKVANESGVWAAAKKKATIKAYRQYLDQYAKGQFAEEAWWQIALLRNKVGAYDDYLEHFSSGKFAGEAEQKMADLEEAQEWKHAKERNTISGYRSFMRRFRKSSSSYYGDAEAAIRKLRNVEEEEEEIVETPKVVIPKPKKIIAAKPKIIKDPNLFIDPRDGQKYKTVKLKDGKIWMAQNLNFDVGEGCWFYDDNPKNGAKYGRLYTWEAAKMACPPGWHLPSDEEWRVMAMAYGGYYDWADSKAKGNPKSSYKSLMPGGISGFTAQLGGYRRSDGSYGHLDSNGSDWSSTESSADNAWYYDFNKPLSELDRYYNKEALGLSCRCVQD